jgi:hypothetical protein
MKKQFLFLALAFFTCTFVHGQRFVKTTTPCNDELIKKTPGRWIKTREAFHAKLSQQQQKEIVNRLNAFHQLMYNIYPSPVAFDAVPSFFTADQEFGSQLKFDPSPNVGYKDFKANGIPTVYYSYTGFFCAYGCGRETYEMMRGYPSEDGTAMGVDINSLNSFLKESNPKDYLEIMRINERPIKLMPVVVGKWKGYDVYAPESGSGLKMVLLHRENILPFIPVTRKEYLDRCLECLPQFFDKSLTADTAVVKMIGKQEWDEQVRKFQKIRNDVLKHYQDELQATTAAGLLGSPAIISSYILDIGTDYQIFTKQSAGGRMLVTENPAYMKKDLPKYIPQFMVFTWWDCRCGVDPSLNPYKLINENFPIEKLQAMIDK